MNYLVFDIETIPDTELGRRELGLDAGMPEVDVARAMVFRRLQDAQTEFLPLYQHRVVAISVLLRREDQLRLWSLGRADSGERELVQRFFDGIATFRPDLVSWNGGGFDLPVLHYRALRHGVAAPAYWETGDEIREFRFNNYLNRYHWRHLDLMDVLSGFQNRARAGLDAIAQLLGLPGKPGLAGDQVWPLWLAGEIESIRQYCETDVLNTYLVFLHFQHFRGLLDDAELAAERVRLRDLLVASEAAHLQSFLAAWDSSTEVET